MIYIERFPANESVPARTAVARAGFWVQPAVIIRINEHKALEARVVHRKVLMREVFLGSIMAEA
jgi:hypothetical protein